MIHYLDTSALAKRYMEEPGSRTMRSVLRCSYAAVVRITYAELLAAVAQACHWVRLQKSTALSSSLA